MQTQHKAVEGFPLFCKFRCWKQCGVHISLSATHKHTHTHSGKLKSSPVSDVALFSLHQPSGKWSQIPPVMRHKAKSHQSNVWSNPQEQVPHERTGQQQVTFADRQIYSPSASPFIAKKLWSEMATVSPFSHRKPYTTSKSEWGKGCVADSKCFQVPWRGKRQHHDQFCQAVSKAHDRPEPSSGLTQPPSSRT